VWNQSRSDQLNVLATCSELFKKYLPDKLVFPSLGNHESAPVNSFPPPFITGYNSLDWLLEGAAKDWSSWLPSDAIDTVLKGGFYSVLIQNNLRVISLQTNFCNNKNWWLLINGTDPAGHLSWLVQELQSAEDKGEKVHIIGHIPPGHGDCIKTWSYNYHKIVNRYESTIIGQFFGHQHSNTIQVYYDETNTSRPMSFAILGPSVTTFTNMNLGYSVYTIDGNYSNSTNALLDFEVFYMNLTDANLSNQPKWILEYTASQDYQMKHGFPEDFDDLVKRFENDDELFQKYYKYVSKMHPPSPYCDSTCKSGYICDIKTTRSGDQSLCDKDINHEQMQLTLQKIKAC
jgi:sphingomyelin phosphodiesterase